MAPHHIGYSSFALICFGCVYLLFCFPFDERAYALYMLFVFCLHFMWWLAFNSLHPSIFCQDDSMQWIVYFCVSVIFFTSCVFFSLHHCCGCCYFQSKWWCYILFVFILNNSSLIIFVDIFSSSSWIIICSLNFLVLLLLLLCYYGLEARKLFLFSASISQPNEWIECCRRFSSMCSWVCEQVNMLYVVVYVCVISVS